MEIGVKQQRVQSRTIYSRRGGRGHGNNSNYHDDICLLRAGMVVIYERITFHSMFIQKNCHLKKY